MADHNLRECTICLGGTRSGPDSEICVRTICDCHYPNNVFHSSCIAKLIHDQECDARERYYGVPLWRNLRQWAPTYFNFFSQPKCPNCRGTIANAATLWRQEKAFDRILNAAYIAHHGPDAEGGMICQYHMLDPSDDDELRRPWILEIAHERNIRVAGEPMRLRYIIDSFDYDTHPEPDLTDPAEERDSDDEESVIDLTEEQDLVVILD